MKVLELFSGSQSIGKICREKGWDVVSVDITDYDGLSVPTHTVDVMEFDYKQYEHFDIVWASPPCVNYSTLQRSNYGRTIRGEVYTREIRERNMQESDKLVQKTLEIIEYFKPDLWFIENPQTGELKNRQFMIDLDLPYYDVTYCKYSDWGYRKSTRIWTNKKGFNAKFCKRDCDNYDHENKKHKVEVSRAPVPKECINKYLFRSRIPPLLIQDLFA